MDYIEADVTCEHEWKDIYVAWLSEAGYDSFEETPSGIKGYILKELFDKNRLLEIIRSDDRVVIHEPETKNWNEEWEKNFPMVEVNAHCIIRAPFHKLSKPYGYDIIIQPKMSFGTGHHSTTRLVMNEMMQHDFTGKKVFDYGSGTGVLSILAAKLGSNAIYAIDNDEWSFANAMENAELNRVDFIGIQLGTLDDMKETGFDFILANINKNIILESLRQLVDKLKPYGKLFTSGFFASDVEDITQAAQQYHLNFVLLKTENNWAMSLYQKSE
jgi:ribosomal protein L11 methyltransferase